LGVASCAGGCVGVRVVLRAQPVVALDCFEALHDVVEALVDGVLV
jgi:hypothetical protein